MQIGNAVLAVLLLFSTFACRGNGGNSKTMPSVAGIWAGTMDSEAAEVTTSIRVALQQSGSTVSGEFLCIETDECLHATGTVSGLITRRGDFTASIYFADGHSCGVFDAALEPSGLSGEYACSDSVLNDFGAWTMTRQ